jgi:hypothetical protein
VSLQYRTETYLRKAIRLVKFERIHGDMWSATLNEFGLTATAGSQDDAELRLYAMLTVYILGAHESGFQLPIIDGVDMNSPAPASSTSEPAPEQRDPDQEWFWSPEWQAGEREADDDIAAGRVEVFDSADEFLASFSD